jgi:hypothetical protein
VPGSVATAEDAAAGLAAGASAQNAC